MPRPPRPKARPASASTRSTRTRSIWSNQLAVGAAILLLALALALLEPALLASGWLQIGMSTVIITTIATIALPWHRLPRGAVAAVPLIDILAIGLMTIDGPASVSFLWLLPVLWLASYFDTRVLIAGLTTIGVMLFAQGLANPLNASSTVNLILTLVALAFLGIITNLSTARTRGFRVLLRRQADRLEQSVSRVRAQQARSAQLLETISIGLARLDASGELSPNGAFAEFFALREGRGAPEPGVVEYVSKDGAPLWGDDTLIERARRGEEFDDEVRALRSEGGGWRIVSATARRLVSDTVLDETLVVVYDITALIDARETRERLATIVSHELRNPLTAVLGHAELALDEPAVPERVHRYLELIDSAAQRMESLIDELLATARPAPAAAAGIDVSMIVASSLDSFSATAQHKALTLVADIAPGLRVEGDEFRLRQVCDNIIGNAVKYTAEGSVTVSARRVEGDAVITVEDTGIGIDNNDLAHVFEPYFRAASAIDSDERGTGLGMGIVHEIVTEHGGEISITSTLGEGSTVIVCLPIVADADAGTKAAA